MLGPQFLVRALVSRFEKSPVTVDRARAPELLLAVAQNGHLRTPKASHKLKRGDTLVAAHACHPHGSIVTVVPFLVG